MPTAECGVTEKSSIRYPHSGIALGLGSGAVPGIFNPVLSPPEDEVRGRRGGRLVLTSPSVHPDFARISPPLQRGGSGG